LYDSEATEVLGAALACALPALSDAPAVLHLIGELGAGKTTCARSLLRTLGVAGIVRSPTYTLVEMYPAGPVQCVHVDLYRLQGAEDLEDLGLRDFLAPGNLLLIEWPERGAGLLPPADVAVSLSYEAEGRDATLRAGSSRGMVWLDNLRTETRLIPYLSNLT